MTLQDLMVGQPVTLELVWGEHTHSMKSTVIGINENGALIHPFIYNGVVINLPENKRRDLIFNIYAIDATTNTRKSWKNANVVPVSYKGRTYYACSVNKFKPNAMDSERRQHQRTVINVDGILVGENSGQSYPVKIRDISDNGVSFIADKDFRLTSSIFKIVFSDTVRGNLFNIKLSCKFVRDMMQGEDYFCGCSLLSADKNLLTYVFMKRMETK